MAVVAPAASADTPLTIAYRGGVSPFDSTVHKSVNVVCPTGKKIIGGSFTLEGAPGKIVLDDFIPYDNFVDGVSMSGLIVAAGEIVGAGESSDGTTEPWRFFATAVCAFPPVGYTIRQITSGVASPPANFVDSPCPPERRVLGGGASLSQGFGQVAIRTLDISATNVHVVAKEDVDRFSGNWSVTAYAICADRAANWQVVSQPTPFRADVALTVAAFCPSSQKVIGSGYRISFEGAIDEKDRYITGLRLRISPDGEITATAVATGEFGRPAWSLRSSVVCADGVVVQN